MENLINNRVLIIGAGPAGLTLAYYLAKNHIDYLILEKNDLPGSSWSQMPDHLHLITYWQSNCLIEEDLSLSPPDRAHKAREFAGYLENFVKKHRLKIKTGNKVQEISKVDDLFTVKTQNDLYSAKYVVDCRGYFNFPFIPTFSINGNAPLMIHFKDYKNCSQLNNYKKILIVGKRLSAGQLLNELSRPGSHELFLSARSKIRFSPHPMILNFLLTHLDFLEGLKIRFKIGLKKELDVPMHYNAKRVLKEQTTVVGDIQKIDNKKVYFTCGKIQSIDAIIFATGFKPDPIELRDDFESLSTEGLFYLGRGSQRTFTSRFIRGIREDAPVLCQLILGRLASKSSSQ